MPETLFRVWVRPEDRYVALEASRQNAPEALRQNAPEALRQNAPEALRQNAPNPISSASAPPEGAQPPASEVMVRVQLESRGQTRLQPRARDQVKLPAPLEGRNGSLAASDRLEPTDAVPISTANRTFVPALEPLGDAPETETEGLEPMPLMESTRRFLRPIVGMNPAEARVYRGPLADAVASSRDADAVTVGRDVFMADSHADGQPETLGLLAHELTHVARSLEPLFVPPIARTRDPWNPEARAEEHLALEVESRVLQDAPTRQESGGTFSEGSGQLPGPISGFQETNNTVQDSVPGNAENTRPGRSSANADPWNGLPAPWEPMPTSMGNSSRFESTSFDSGVALGGESGGGLIAQIASRDRDLSGESSNPSTSSDHKDATGHGKRDVDAFARQVYAILKRRLEAERRRGL